MSWLGVKYAFACRDPRVKGSGRLVLLALGARLEHRRVTTPPTSLAELQWLTGLSVEQLRRVLDDLETWGKVRRLSRGKNAVYALPEMAGPLFTVDEGDSVKMTDFEVVQLPEKIGQDARKVSGKMPGFRRRMTDFSGRRAGGVLFSQVLGTEVPVPTAATAHDEHAAVADFLAWVRASFPLYVPGATTETGAKQTAAVLELLRGGRSVERLKLMAVLLWQLPADRVDAWLATSDRGLLVLRYRADQIDRLVSEQTEAWRVCPHVPHCAVDHPCVPGCTHHPPCLEYVTCRQLRAEVAS